MSDRLTRTLLVLTFVTGIVDAVSFLALGQVFAAMQTGNVIFLGLGFAGASGASLLPPLIGLVAFIAGGSAAALLLGPGQRSYQALATAIGVEIVLLATAAAAAAVVDVEPEQLSAYALIAALSLAMGMRNTVARRAGDPNLATTVLNLTVSAFGDPSPLGVAQGEELTKRALAFAAILAGAACGALLLEASLGLAIGAAAAITVIAALGHGLRRP